jgi:hypothetical protein
MESTGAAYAPRTTRAAEEPSQPKATYNMSPAGSRPPRQTQPGMDALAAEQQ